MACHPRAGPSGREAAAADPRITALGSTTFPGRRLTRRRPDEVRQTIEMFPDDSRGELARTIRGHLDRNTPEGDCRVPAGLGLPEQLEALGILTLKAPIIHVRGPPVPDRQPGIEGAVDPAPGPHIPVCLEKTRRKMEAAADDRPRDHGPGRTCRGELAPGQPCRHEEMGTNR